MKYARLCSKAGAQGTKPGPQRPTSRQSTRRRSRGPRLEDGLPRGLASHRGPQGLAWRHACEDLLARLGVDQRPMPAPLLGLVREWATVTAEVEAHRQAERYGPLGACRNQLASIFRQAETVTARMPKPKPTQASPWEKE